MNTLEKDIKIYEDKPLSSKELTEMSMRLYPVRTLLDVPKFNTLEELLGPNGCILFWEVDGPYSGHFSSMWISLNKLYIFDSYGFNIYEDIKYSTYLLSQGERVVNALPNLVNEWVQRNNGRIITSTTAFQNRYSPNRSTCGRWALIRLLNSKKTHEEFGSWMKYKSIPSDELVTLLTFLIDELRAQRM